MQIILHSSNGFLASFYEALAFILHTLETLCQCPLQCILCNFDLPFTLMVYLHLRFIRRELLRELLSPHKYKK